MCIPLRVAYPKMQIISSKEFVYTFCDIWNSTDRRICFVLGAGASKSSGIRTGGELAEHWLDFIKGRLRDQPTKFETFLKTHKIDTANPGAHYPEIYKERFRLDYDTGFEFINREMESAKPSYGYSVLAQILAEKQHNIIITTNFDNLTEEALYTYTNKRPLICGHESLAVFAKPSVKRPLIVKIHRDRFFNPQSLPDEINRINELWIDALNSIFVNGTPIFIGYGGNDGSLMGYLEKINSFQNIFWCERKGVPVSDRVANLLEKFNGKLVEIEGFDELMFLLQDGLRLKLLNKEIVEIAEERAKAYKETVEKIRKAQAGSPDIDAQKAAERIVDKAGDDWWSWELKAQAAKTNEEKEQVYNQALIALPDNPQLHHSYAGILEKQTKHDQAEEHHVRSLDLDPDDDLNIRSYANFLTAVRKDHDKAEWYYKKALEINPDNELNCGAYADFLDSVRKDFKNARRYYLKAIRSNPTRSENYFFYAAFLQDSMKDYDQSEVNYITSLAINPQDPMVNLWYGKFLEKIRKAYSAAEKYYKIALGYNPDDAGANETYANFLKNIRSDASGAEKYYQRAKKGTQSIHLSKETK